jgi:hypothetical protein
MQSGSDPHPADRTAGIGPPSQPGDPGREGDPGGDRRRDEDEIFYERADRAWQRQLDAEDADRTRGGLGSGARLRWLLLAIAGFGLIILLIERLGAFG